MFVDSDYEELDPIDTSYGYARETNKTFTAIPKEEEYVEEVEIATSGKLIPSIEPFGFSSQFLVRPSKSQSRAPNHAQKSAIDAGCGEDVVKSLSSCRPSELEGRMKKMRVQDRILLDEQLDREAISHWNSSSVYSGLGADENGNMLGLSLNRLNDLICNANEHILIIRREIIRYQFVYLREKKEYFLFGKEIDASRTRGTCADLGFNKADNRNQLEKVCASLSRASRVLADQVDGLSHSVKLAGEASSSVFSSFAIPVILVATSAAVGCAIMILRQK